MNRNLLFALALGTATLAASCTRGPEDTGTQYAPQMYEPIAYDPYKQIVDTNSEDYNSNPYNPHRMTMRKPAQNTIARKQWEGTPRTVLANDIMEYNIPSPDSINWSSRNLKCPLPATKKVLVEGELLYLQFCSACHGKNGKADGKVAEQYKGVPSYASQAVKNLTEGHIYHTITYGKGRMWPHGSQVNPDHRWKIVRYVQTLQKQAN